MREAAYRPAYGGNPILRLIHVSKTRERRDRPLTSVRGRWVQPRFIRSSEARSSWTWSISHERNWLIFGVLETDFRQRIQ